MLAAITASPLNAYLVLVTMLEAVGIGFVVLGVAHLLVRRQ